jgi:hypothetical protein
LSATTLLPGQNNPKAAKCFALSRFPAYPKPYERDVYLTHRLLLLAQSLSHNKKPMKQVSLVGVLLLLLIGTASANALPSPTPLLIVALADTPPPPRPTLRRDLYFNVEAAAFGPRALQPTVDDYPQLVGESRLVIWIVAQQHLYWVAFVLGTFCITTLLEVWALLGPRSNIVTYDALARECLSLVMLAVTIAGTLGGLLLISLLVLYPQFTSYLISLYRPVLLVYGVLILAFTLLAYLYHVTWQQMEEGWSKWLHASLGILTNVIGTTIAFVGNAWSSFMLSPAGIDEFGRYLGNSWHVIHSALWNPFNVHRFSSHLLCASAVLGAYAAYRALTAHTHNERAHYDWLGLVAACVLVGALITMPFGGYWLSKEIYAYKQWMGITLFGGLLAWLGVVLVVAMGLLFFSINYYVWQRIASSEGGKTFVWATKWVFGGLAFCTAVYITPHTMVMNPVELIAMGGQQHQVLGNYGVESAKSTAGNLMILITGWSWILWRFSHNALRDDHSRRLLQINSVGFVLAALNVIWLGIYGYYIPANVRVGLSVPMAMTTFTAVLVGLLLASWRTKGGPEHQVQWGTLPRRGYFALLAMSFLAIWIMGLGGYRRSSLRLFWHITDIMKDGSPWAFTHTIGFAVNVISLNALIFLLGVTCLLGLAKAARSKSVSEAMTSRSEVLTHL